jgi:hypothetical protein
MKTQRAQLCQVRAFLLLLLLKKASAPQSK